MIESFTVIPSREIVKYLKNKEIYFDEKGYPTQFIDHMKPTTSICDGEELDTILWEIEQDNKRQKGAPTIRRARLNAVCFRNGVRTHVTWLKARLVT